MSDFFRHVAIARAMKANDASDRQPAVRLYRNYNGKETKFELQVRGPLQLANGRSGRDFVIGHATLDIHDVAALRDAFEAALVEFAAEHARCEACQGIGCTGGAACTARQKAPGFRITLEIGPNHYPAVDLKDARAMYCQHRDDSGEGASGFPEGKITDLDGKTYRISYNGRIWDGANEVKL